MNIGGCIGILIFDKLRLLFYLCKKNIYGT